MERKIVDRNDRHAFDVVSTAAAIAGWLAAVAFPIVARRDAVAVLESAAEVGGAVEAPAEADLRDRQAGEHRARQVEPAALEAPHAQIGREVLTGAGEQLLQRSRRDAVRRRDL